MDGADRADESGGRKGDGARLIAASGLDSADPDEPGAVSIPCTSQPRNLARSRSSRLSVSVALSAATSPARLSPWRRKTRRAGLSQLVGGSEVAGAARTASWA